MSTESSHPDDTIDHGVPIIESPNRRRFVLFPEGEFRPVDHDFDRAVLTDPDAQPATDPESIVPSAEPTPDAIRAIAQAMLATEPSGLAAVLANSSGRVIGATIIRAPRGLTPAVVRAAMRSAVQGRAKRITLASRQPASPELRNAAAVAADVTLVTVDGFLTIGPS